MLLNLTWLWLTQSCTESIQNNVCTRKPTYTGLNRSTNILPEPDVVAQALWGGEARGSSRPAWYNRVSSRSASPNSKILGGGQGDKYTFARHLIKSYRRLLITTSLPLSSKDNNLHTAMRMKIKTSRFRSSEPVLLPQRPRLSSQHPPASGISQPTL